MLVGQAKVYVRQLQHNLNTELLFRNVSCATQMGQLASSGQSLKVDDCSRTLPADNSTVTEPFLGAVDVFSKSRKNTLTRASLQNGAMILVYQKT